VLPRAPKCSNFLKHKPPDRYVRINNNYVFNSNRCSFYAVLQPFFFLNVAEATKLNAPFQRQEFRCHALIFFQLSPFAVH
jgi:hypothetical protein